MNTEPVPADSTGSPPIRPAQGSHAAPEEPVSWVVASDGEAVLEDPPKAEPSDEHGAAVARWRRKNDRRTAKKRPFWVELPILILIAFALTFLIQTFIAKVYYVPSGSMEQTLHGVENGGDRILASKIVYDFRHPEQGDVVVFKGPDTWAAEADIPGPSSWLGKFGQAVGSVIGIAPANEKDFVKRVIAVGGQSVSCCDAQGNMQVDGRSLSEPYIYQNWPFTPGDASSDCTKTADGMYYTSQRCFDPIKVPDGQLWVMGDHRSDSLDSFYYCRGLTTKGQAAYQQGQTQNNAEANDPNCGRPIPADNVIGKAIFIVMPPSRWRTIGNPDIDPGAVLMSGGFALGAPAAGGVGITLLLRGGLAMTPTRRRRRSSRRRVRRP